MKTTIHYVAAMLCAAMLLSSCSSPSSPNDASSTAAGGGGITNQHVNDHTSQNPKGKNTIQSVNVTINNNTSESMTIRMLMASGYSDLFISPNGTFYHGLASAMTGLVINYQSIPQNTPTTVTLPNDHQVKVTWNAVEQGGNIVVVVEINTLD